MKINKNDQRIAFWVPGDLKKRFDEKAQSLDQSMSDRLRLLMEKDAGKK